MNDITDGDDCQRETCTIVDNSFAVNPEAAAPVDQSAGTTTRGMWCQVPHSLIERIGEIGHAPFFTYLAILRHANRDRIARPGQKRLAAITKLSTRTIIRAVKTLVELGLIQVERQESRAAPNRYRVLDNLPPVDVVTPMSPHSDTSVTRVVTPMSHRSDTHVTTVVTPMSHEVDTEKKIQEVDTREVNTRKKERAPAPPDSRLLFLIDQWNERKLGPTVRRDPPPKDVLRNWASMLKDQDGRSLIDTEDALTLLLDSVSRNTWATGNASWGLTWLLTRNGAGEWKAAKLLRGEYANTSRTPNTASSRLGPGVVYDPTAKERDPNYGSI
jgi:hypothetical protein